MKRIVFAGVTCLCLSGCANQAAIKAAALREDDAICKSMGFEVETDAYKQCRFTSYQNRENRAAAIAAAAASRPRISQPFQTPAANGSYIPALNFQALTE